MRSIPLSPSLSPSRFLSDLGHADQSCTDTAAWQRFWCPNQHWVIRDICNACFACLNVKNPNPAYRAPLQLIKVDYPNQIVGVDLMGPMPPSAFGNRYILVLIDFFTKWYEAVLLSEANIITVAKAIFSEWYAVMAFPSNSIQTVVLNSSRVYWENFANSFIFVNHFLLLGT
nr:unnamed protein product [Spirometra erinaceieuropaei]